MNTTYLQVYLAVSLGCVMAVGAYRWSAHPEELNESLAPRRAVVSPEVPSQSPQATPYPTPAVAAPTVPTPTALAPPPTPALETATCRQISGPFEIARNAELDIGVFLRTDGNQVAAGWVVPARRSPGPDDVSIAWLNADGSFREWSIEGVQNRQRDQGQPSSSVTRVLPVLTNGSLVPRVDRRYVNPNGQWTIECGSVGNIFASPLQTEPDLPPVLAADWNAMFWCRSADVADPFVLAGRTALDGSGQLTGEARFFATRTPGAPLPERYWTLRYHHEQVATARDPSAKLREVAGPAKLTVAQTPQGYVVSFIHRSRLHLGWLDTGLNPIGNLTVVPTLGSTPGRATLRWNGSEVVMIFADRATSNDLYALRGARISFGGTLPSSNIVPLSASPDHLQHEIAPDLTRLDDGTFLLTWTYGAENARAGMQQIYVRRYDANLGPRGGPLSLTSPASDSEVIGVNGNNVVLVAMSGTSGMRNLVSMALHCDP